MWFSPKGPIEDEEEADTVVQPDLLVICDRKKVVKRGCIGAPDLVVEILSPSTALKDMTVKHELYERHGVREYWIVDPGNRVMHRYVLSEGAGGEKRYAEAESFIYDEKIDRKKPVRFESAIFPGFSIKLSAVFDDLWGGE